MTLWGWLPERWVAVDCDQRTIRGVVARRWGAAWTVEGWTKEEYPGEETGQRTAALRRLLDALRAGRARVVLVLPRRLFLERMLTAPPLAPRLLRALVAQELDADLPWAAGERCDVFALLPSGEPRGAATRRLLAVAGQREALVAWFAVCRAVGGRVAGAVPAGVALLNAFRTSGEPGTGFLAGARDEVDLISLAGDGWGFSRAFPRAEVGAEIVRSRQFAGLAGNGPVELRVPAGTSWPSSEGFTLREWRPAGIGELPAEYWAAWGAALTAGGSPAALPLMLDGEAGRAGRSLRPGIRVAALVLAAAAALLGAGAGVYRAEQRRAAERASAALAGQSAELAAWRTVAFPLDRRLAVLDSLAARLPARTRLEALRLEGDRLVELRAVAPRASAVLSALTGAPGLTGLALAGPVVRRAEGSEAFSLIGRLAPPAPAPKPAADATSQMRAVAALRALGWADLPPDQAVTRLLLEVERAAAGAEMRLETKSAQLLASPPGRQRLGVDVSFPGGDRSLAAFLGELAERTPLLSLDVLAARRVAGTGDAISFRLQVVLDRPSSAPPGVRPVPARAVPPRVLAETAGLTVPRGDAYPHLWAGRLFGLDFSPAPAAAPPPPVRSSGAPPASAEPSPEPPQSNLVLLGVVYDDPAGRAHALVRPAGSGATAVVKPGDVVGEERIVEIRKDGIVVEIKGVRVRLPLP
jgi:hypothetical protein